MRNLSRAMGYLDQMAFEADNLQRDHLKSEYDLYSDAPYVYGMTFDEIKLQQISSPTGRFRAGQPHALSVGLPSWSLQEHGTSPTHLRHV